MDTTLQVKIFRQEVKKVKSEHGGNKYNFLVFIQLKQEIGDFWTEAFFTHDVRSTLGTSKMAQD